ncbi:hypothetical protein BaRGS_00000277 [Batillaria attramentaria]|uniref:Uncharacterized protein n=1 Tax=Batillaria attramentaria TaxID=370345 RepID=A0ABD0MD19_9CAEN
MSKQHEKDDASRHLASAKSDVVSARNLCLTRFRIQKAYADLFLASATGFMKTSVQCRQAVHSDAMCVEHKERRGRLH